jgi:hypothetical protein
MILPMFCLKDEIDQMSEKLTTSGKGSYVDTFLKLNFFQGIDVAFFF